MHYEGNMIRPPSEAYSILLQVTVGCSHNKCTFCGAYRDVRFKVKPDDIVMADIAFAAQNCRQQRRVFLCDGDAIVLPQKRLLKILKEIKEQLPWVTRIGAYANAKNLKRKSLEELIELRENGLKILYMGLESGEDHVLTAVRKKSDAMRMIEEGRKVRDAGIKLSVTVLLGLAGPDLSDEHAVQTGKVLSAMDPDYIGALSLMLVPGTPLYEDYQKGEFKLIEPMEMLQELQTIIRHTNLTKGLFHANHASNYLPIKARLPKDKASVLQMIDQALDGQINLKPEWLRGL